MERSDFLDTLRGFALLGILPVNIPLMAGPAMAMLMAGNYSLTGIDGVAGHVTDGLFAFRFVTLFSMMFGIGIVIMRQRCEAKGIEPRALLRRRYIALLVFGMLHFAFLWFGDILFIYGAWGLAIGWCAKWRAGTLAVVGLVLAMIPSVFFAGLGGLIMLGEAAGGGAEIGADVAGFGATLPENFSVTKAAVSGNAKQFMMGMGSFDPAFEIAVNTEGSFVRASIYRCLMWLIANAFFMLFFSWRIVGMFFIGMALAKSEWFLWPSRYRTRFAMMGAAGMVGGVALQLPYTLFNDEFIADDAITMLLGAIQMAASLFMAFGYAGLLGLLCGSKPEGAIRRMFRAVGRTAFSNYILQSVIVAAIFHGWGLGLYGQAGVAMLWLFVIGIWLFQMGLSDLYLRRFRMGPLEWLWRKWTYGKQAEVRPLGAGE